MKKFATLFLLFALMAILPPTVANAAGAPPSKKPAVTAAVPTTPAAAAVPAPTTVRAAAEADPAAAKLTEIEQLRLDKLNLQGALLKSTYHIDEFEKSMQELTTQMRGQIDRINAAHPGYTFDPQTGTLVVKKTAPPPPQPVVPAANPAASSVSK